MATVQASAIVVAGAAPVVLSSNAFASSKSVSFGNGGVRGVAFVRARTVRPLTVRAEDGESILDKAKAGIEDAVDKLKGGADDAKGFIPTTQDSVGQKTTGAGPTVGNPISSTGGITDKAKELAEKTATTFDGVKENIDSKLKDGDRELKSKTGDVVYGDKRNAQ